MHVSAMMMWSRTASVVAISCAGLIACQPAPLPDVPPDLKAELVAKGRRIFFNETFNGNGRTCGTCHPADNNFTIDSPFIARLAKDNPLFVAEFNPNLTQAIAETGDAIRVLEGAKLHAAAIVRLQEARRLERKVERAPLFRGHQLCDAIEAHRMARAELTE